MRRLIDLWFKPSHNLGALLTCAGIAVLMVSLILNRVSPETLTYDPDDWRAASRVIGYVGMCWAVWVIGVVLVIVGAARIMTMIDD
jgi:hypothetical protein